MLHSSFPLALYLHSPANAGDASSTPALGDPLEEEMATHSSILAWKMPWTEEPGGLQSMGSQRVRHAWVTEQARARNCLDVSAALSVHPTPLPPP